MELNVASLRNVIERAFGVLKKRFSIIAGGSETHYPVDTMSLIIIACCILHNFLMTADPNEALLADVDRELEQSGPSTGPSTDNARDHHINDEDATRGNSLRDSVASAMWEDYILSG